MGTTDHDEVTRRSFTQQTGLFTGADAVFARKRGASLAWLEPLEPHMIVLDVACGAADVAEAAAPFVHQVVGVDLTPALLALAGDRLRTAGIANVLLQEGNATALPFLDGSFDLVACRTALHHFPEPQRAVAEMARVCRPGGRVAVVDMVSPGADARAAFDALHRQVDPSHVAVLTEAELADLIGSTVGALSGEESTTFTIPVDLILTEASDREAVMQALHAELDGGPATGFQPALEDDQVHVTFVLSGLSAAREP